MLLRALLLLLLPLRLALLLALLLLLLSLLTLLLDSYRARWHWLSWAGCTLYAATDEIHQLFVAGRTGKWQDVLLDSSGALAGLMLAMFMLWLIRRRRAKKQST